MPRPWLLYCSPQSLQHLRNYGFDLLDDYVDHSYDNVDPHFERLHIILDQLEQPREYTDADYVRFQQAAKQNRDLLIKYSSQWPARFAAVKAQI
jgi:hypothetical protein